MIQKTQESNKNDMNSIEISTKTCAIAQLAYDA